VGKATKQKESRSGEQAPPSNGMAGRKGNDVSACEEALLAAQGVLFDMDGVLWHGGVPIEGAGRVLATLQARGKTLIFVTNNAAKARGDYVRKIQRLCGVAVDEAHILSSAAVAAELCRGRKKAYVIGEAGLFSELRRAGVDVLGEHDSARRTDPQSGEPAPAVDPDVSDVVVGFDGSFNYYKLAVAARYLRECHSRFVACNTDRVVPVTDGILLPGCGAIVAALQACVPASVPLVVCGKPEPHFWRLAADRFGLDAARCVMVGDNLETDIAFGSRCRLQTLLVLSGVTTQAQLDRFPTSPSSPTFVIPSLDALFH